MSRQNISILIVDDEPEARDLLSMLLDRIEGVELAGTADGVDLAFEQILSKEPDLVMLDIQMPVKNGFELVKMVHDANLSPGFIFVTAYDEYAIEAIRSSAFDYLLKPVDTDELQKSVSRFRDQMEVSDVKQQLEEMLLGLGKKSRIKVNTRTGFILINPEEIIHCIASGNYTEVHMVNQKGGDHYLQPGIFHGTTPGQHFFQNKPLGNDQSQLPDQG